MVSALRCTSITFYFYVLLVNNPPCAYLCVPFYPRAPSELACLPKGFQPGRGMPSKIECETENRSMEEVEDTIAETKTLKVSKVSGVVGNGPNQPFGYRDLLPGCSMFDNMWLNMLPGLKKPTYASFIQPYQK